MYNSTKYVCYIDFQKAFDLVNRNILDDMLIKTGQAPESCVRVNAFLTNWFFTSSRVKQGDALSPTLFAVDINDLVRTIKSLGCGVKFGEANMSIVQ